MSTLVEEMNRLYRNHVQVRPAKQTPKRKPGKSRKRLSMRPEKRPQTIMEQYRYREMMRQPHNKPLLGRCLGFSYIDPNWEVTEFGTLKSKTDPYKAFP
jgi:hypothetical protein